MSHVAAYLAFETQLKAWAASKSPALRVAMPNVTFTQKSAEIYFRSFSIPADTRNDDVSLDTQTYVGVLQIDVVFPKDIGIGKANEYIDELTEVVFKRNSWLSKGEFKAQLTTPLNPGPMIAEGTNFFVPCSIRYWARLVIAS